MKVRIQPRRIVLTLTFDPNEITQEDAVREFSRATEPLLDTLGEHWPAANASVDVEVHGDTTTSARPNR